MKNTLLLGTAIAMFAAFDFAFSAPASEQAKPEAKPDAKPKAAAKPAAKPQAKSDPTEQALLLGQFGDWGAYKASPGGKKVCFVLAKPASAVTEPAGRPRDPSYAFVSTRPAEKVKNEVSVIVGYTQKLNYEASAAVGSANYMMYTQNDGAWIKNAAEEPRLLEAMRKAGDLVVRGTSARGTESIDHYSLKGLGQAMDRVAQECK